MAGSYPPIQRVLAHPIFGVSPDVTLQAVGPLATNPAVISEVAAEQSSLQHHIHDHKYYPVVQIGLNYRF